MFAYTFTLWILWDEIQLSSWSLDGVVHHLSNNLSCPVSLRSHQFSTSLFQMGKNNVDLTNITKLLSACHYFDVPIFVNMDRYNMFEHQSGVIIVD